MGVGLANLQTWYPHGYHDQQVGKRAKKLKTKRREETKTSRIEQGKIEATGVAIMFTIRRGKGGKGAVKFLEYILKQRGRRFLDMVKWDRLVEVCK